MPGRQEFGVSDIKAEPLGLAMPLNPGVAAPARGRGLFGQLLCVEPEQGAPVATITSAMFPRPCEQARSPG